MSCFCDELVCFASPVASWKLEVPHPFPQSAKLLSVLHWPPIHFLGPCFSLHCCSSTVVNHRHCDAVFKSLFLSVCISLLSLALSLTLVMGALWKFFIVYICVSLWFFNNTYSVVNTFSLLGFILSSLVCLLPCCSETSSLEQGWVFFPYASCPRTAHC